jgi:hypothetical protein
MEAEGQDIQRIRSGALSTLVIGFGIDETLIDRAARESGGPVDRLFLRDRVGDGYYGGAEGLGDTIEGTVAALARLIDNLSPDRIVTIGPGIGGHAALIYGCLLGASRIVSIEPYAHLVEEILEKYHDKRWHRELSQLPDPTLARRFEIPRLFEREQYSGQAHILLGTRPLHEGGDAVHLNAIHAHWLGRSAQVFLHPFSEYNPALLPGLDGGDRAIRLLSQFLFDDIPESSNALEPEIMTSYLTQPKHPIQYNAKLTICRIDERNPTNTSGVELTYASAGEVDVAMTRKMNDGLRQWIVENLLLDASPEDLANTLEVRGISRKETLQEVEIARFHPYFFASQRLLNRISKRDWLVATYRKLNRMNRKSIKIERREKPTVAEFLKEYYSTGRPLILTGMMDLSTASKSRCLAEIYRRSVDEQGHDKRDAIDSVRVMDLIDVWPATAEIFDHERQIVDRTGAILWQDAAGSIAPDRDERFNGLIAELEGKGRVRLIPWWDVLLLEEADRSSRKKEDLLSAASHLTPLDRPESLEFNLNPGELLFVPAGCRVQFECLEAVTMIWFERFMLDAITYPS